LRNLGLGASPESLLPPDWDDALLKFVGAGLEVLALKGAQTEMRLFGPEKAATPFEVKADESIDQMRLSLPQRVLEAVKAFLAGAVQEPHWKAVTQGVRDDVGAALKEAIDEGENLDQQAKRVQNALGGASRDRAVRIARTETTGALNAGHEASRAHLQEMGLVKGKEWLCITDGDTRPEHAQANGQVVEAGGEFLVGGERCRYPGDQRLSPGNRIHCRCTAVTVVDEESLQ
jgi:SPP1 gp7 family putative phage head morphogenesis protein